MIHKIVDWFCNKFLLKLLYKFHIKKFSSEDLCKEFGEKICGVLVMGIVSEVVDEMLKDFPKLKWYQALWINLRYGLWFRKFRAVVIGY
jgi:hypothetical protein